MIPVILLALLAFSSDAATRFPGERVQSTSPTGRFAVRWLEPKSGSGNPEHQLLLRDLGNGKDKLLLRFGRWVEVLWAPDGRRLAITNGIGSDSTETSIVLVGSDQPVPVWPLLEQQVGKEGLAFASGAHHLYVEGKGWLSSNTLKVRVWGYGGPKAFDRVFQVVVSQ